MAGKNLKSRPPSRINLRFSLRTLLVLTLFSGWLLAWYARSERRKQVQQEAIKSIEQLGGSLAYNDGKVVEINLFRCGIDDDALDFLRVFDRVVVLHLGMNRITDEGLAKISHMRQLEVLTLQVTHVTDTGLSPLESLTRLQRVILPSNNGKITDDGIKRLRSVLPNCDVDQ